MNSQTDMEALNRYIKKNSANYTFEDYCEDNSISDDMIDNSVHEDFVDFNWSFVRHRPYYLYKSKIYETLLKSYDSNKLYNEILKKYGQYIVDKYSAYKDKSTVKSIILIYKYSSKFTKEDEFQHLLNLYNYFITYDDINNHELHLEPNVPDDCTEFIYNDCNGILYHVTNKYIYEEKIKKFGLKPKTATYRYFPERVFYVAGTNKKDIVDNIEFVKDILKDDDIYKKYEMIILKVDLNKYKNKVSIFKDNGMENDSYWCGEYIPPYCIEETNIEDIQ